MTLLSMIDTGPPPRLRKSFRFGIDARCLDTPRIHSIYLLIALPNSSRTGSLQLSRAGRHATEWPREGPASSPGASSTCAAAIQAARTARKGRVFAFFARSTSSFPRRSRERRWRSGRRRTLSSVARCYFDGGQPSLWLVPAFASHPEIRCITSSMCETPAESSIWWS